jgi:hypothetical protein
MAHTPWSRGHASPARGASARARLARPLHEALTGTEEVAVVIATLERARGLPATRPLGARRLPSRVTADKGLLVSERRYSPEMTSGTPPTFFTFTIQ